MARRTRSRSGSRLGVASLLERQQEFVHDLVADYKEEIQELLDTNSRNFRSKALEKQYTHNQKVLVKSKKILKLLRKDKVRKAKDLVKDLIGVLEDHSEDLIVADTSRHGWLTVHQLRGGDKLSSNLQRKIERSSSISDRGNRLN